MRNIPIKVGFFLRRKENSSPDSGGMNHGPEGLSHGLHRFSLILLRNPRQFVKHLRRPFGTVQVAVASFFSVVLLKTLVPEKLKVAQAWNKKRLPIGEAEVRPRYWFIFCAAARDGCGRGVWG